MLNFSDYIDWRGDISFKDSPCNEVDMAICSYLSIMNLDGILNNSKDALPLKEVTKLYFEKEKAKTLGVLQPAKLPSLLEKLANSVRFSDVLLCMSTVKINHENNEQFGAVTILLPDRTLCVSFQGTDDTLTGWKEDCNLAIYDKVPAQEDAREYLEDVASRYFRKIRICGHSKGGNLAVSAAMLASKRVQNKIIEVYNFDGPGFYSQVLESDKFLSIKDRVISVLPQHSVIGILMQTPGKIIYANSSVSGPFSHDCFNWAVQGTQFVRCESLAPFSTRLEKAINTTIDKMTSEEKKQFVEELFKTLSSRGATTVTELTKMKITDIITVLMSINGDKNVKLFINGVIKALTKIK